MRARESEQPRELGTVFVTGGSSGLGAAVVHEVMREGGRAAVLDLTTPSVDVPHAVVDLCDGAATEAAVADLVGRVGKPTALVTAAGIDACGPLASVPRDAWERVVRVNLLGTAAVVRACLPHLVEGRGTVVTVASTLGVRAVGDATAYCASKFGVIGFTRALAAELAGQVGVTLLIPGGMQTHFFDGRSEQYRPGPNAELNDPAHVAHAVLVALQQPVGCEVRELVVASSREPSWP